MLIFSVEKVVLVKQKVLNYCFSILRLPAASIHGLNSKSKKQIPFWKLSVMPKRLKTIIRQDSENTLIFSSVQKELLKEETQNNICWKSPE